MEGKFGQPKTKFGMDKIKMRGNETSKLQIHLIALSMNILCLWKGINFLFLTLARSINGVQKRQKANSKGNKTERGKIMQCAIAYFASNRKMV
ncbi:MAG: hypothetical protein ACNS60_09745 [Candidatus Cyclobacteriaceae bacterium M2_1C_046]